MIVGELMNDPQNPIPQGGNVTLIDTDDGAHVRAAWWPSPSKKPLGTVCLFQGRAEFIEKHAEVITELLDRNFAVVTFDWRGQGHSSRDVQNPRKGHIDDFSSYHLDADTIFEKLLKPLMPQPYFGIAFSMGGAIALDMASAQKLPFDKLIIVAPMLKIQFVNKPKLAKLTAELLCALGFAKAFIPFGKEASVSTRPFPNNRLSSDPIRYGRISALATAMGPAAIGAPTIGWTRAAFRLMNTLANPEKLKAIQIPTIIMPAGSDRVCDSRATEKAAQHLPKSKLIVIPNSQHEVWQEQDSIRQYFWDAFDAFIRDGLE